MWTDFIFLLASIRTIKTAIGLANGCRNPIRKPEQGLLRLLH